MIGRTMPKKIAEEEFKKLLYKPDSVTPPGYTLLDLLEERGMTPGQLSYFTDRTIENINNVLEGRVPISQVFAIELEDIFGVPAEFWLAREKNYRDYLDIQKTK